MDFSIHPDIFNKPIPFNPVWARGWQQLSGELIDLREHVSRGGAFVAAAMTSDHRSSAAFKSSELVVVDVDHGLKIEDFSAHPLAGSASFLYTTHSHSEEEHRFRIVFRLPQVITSEEVYKAITNILIKSIGGDKSCSDACRLFYGNKDCQVPIWQPKACLSEDIIQQGKDNAALERARFNASAADFDPDDIQRAVFCLEQIIEPTVDGEREPKFLPITMACSRVGDALFPAWSDWAFRGYHGKKNGQASERYFRSSRSSKHTLGTIFHHANKDDPDWRSRLPEDLKPKGDFNPAAGKAVIGYEHSAFTGDEYDEAGPEVLTYERFTELALESKTTSIFDEDKPWTFSPDDAPELPEADDDDDGPANRSPGRPSGDAKEPPEITTRKAITDCYPDLRYNTTSGTYEYGPITDPRLISNDQIERAYLHVSWTKNGTFQKQLVKDTICTLADENKYSPVVTYLNHCAANAKPIDYFDCLATTLLGSPPEGVNNPRLDSGQLFHDAILQRFFVGAVARALDPGVTHDWMPILVGNQACGKTSFLQYITPPNRETNRYEWAATIQQDLPSLANRPHKLHAGWIVVLDECERYFGRRYVEQLKNLVSTSVDRSDLKYRNEMNFPRTFVLAGACNSADFLTDPTGNRRFMPVLIDGIIPSGKRKVIDLDRVKAERNQIWAAAFKAYQDNPVHTFDSSELAQVADYVDNFNEDNPLESLVLNNIAAKISGERVVSGSTQRYWTVSDLMGWMEVPIAQQPSMTRSVTDILKRHGYGKVRHKRTGARNATSIWVRLTE